MSTAAALDAEIIEFFRAHQIDFEEDDHERQVMTVEDCRQALRDQLAWEICDPESLVEAEVSENPDADPDEVLHNHAAALQSLEVAVHRGESWLVARHQAAALLGTTVEAVVKTIEPLYFAEFDA